MKYIVKPGDTLWGISNQYGVSVLDIVNLNNISGTDIKVGQSLLIPNESGTNPDNIFMYTVKKGDSLWAIAKIYGTSVLDIKKLNNLTNNNLYIGQVLKIPENYSDCQSMGAPNYINYKVVKGDTLYSIAKKYGISVDTIVCDNALKNNILNVGQNIRIRVDADLDEECFGEEYNPSTNTTYKVVKGDTLYSIAKRFNSTVLDIKNKNNLTNNNLYIGQVLKI